MSLLPDPDALVAVADRITAHATAVRRHAQLLAGSLGHTTWFGAAAQAFAHVALEVCGSLRRCAERLDAAAAHLRQHAARVRAALDELADAAAGAARVGLHAVQSATELGHAAGHVLHAVGI